jgi:DNA-binding response OmpR family regulator
MSRILIIEDERGLALGLRANLEIEGYEVSLAHEGEEGFRHAVRGAPDLVILDLMLPDVDGYDVLRRMRQARLEMPVLLLTARSEELEKTRGLRAGADDYVTKPFGRQELLARIEALLRRVGGREREAAESYSDAFVSIDFAQRSVKVGEREVELTPREFKLLAEFVRHPNQVLSHDQLLELVWGERDASREQVKLYVGYLRRKLAPDEPDAVPIETRRGFGYAYRPRRAS